MSTAPHLPNKDQLAMDRTWLAHERTLMAWVIMVSIGLLSLLTATISHRKDVRGIRVTLHKHSLDEVLAWLVSAFGFVVLFSALARD
jgi:uncharacterized membrane protein YidH (DUF202 family)